MLKLVATLLLLGCALATPTIRHRYQQNAIRALKGYKNVEGRIVGGVESSIEDFPYQVGLFYNRWHTCGGSIINHRTILTAAHCTYDRDHSNFQVLVGHADINEEDYLIDVTRLVEHEGYDDWEIINDVAVLNIDEPLVWSNRINHVDLPLWNYYVPSGRILTVSGWGDLEYDAQEYPDILMSVEVPALSNPECQDVYDEEEILEQHICAGAGGIDACHGDSGKDQIA